MPNDSPAPSPALAAIEALGESECRALLARHRLCTMSVVDADEPYAVPLFYGFDGATLYLGLAEGRKTRVLDANPRLCITVTELGSGDGWASVQVTGRAEWLDAGAREAGVKILTEHNRRVRSAAVDGAEAPSEPAGASGQPRRHGGGRILRVSSPEFTGRARR